MSPAVPASAPAPKAGSGWFATAGRFLALMAGYFALHIVIRTLTSPSVDLDESEQVVFTQRLCRGYGPAPPLYTWLQITLFSLFGQGVFALALLKNLLLFATYSLTYHNARLITGRHDCGVAAALSLLFIPAMAWESQRDLTHTVLATTMAAATLACFLQLQETGRTRWYLLLGLAMGGGLLAKFNFALWVLGLLGAALFGPRLRKGVLDWRMVLALALCGLMVIPYGLWVFQHWDLAFGSATKLSLGEQSWPETIWRGLRNVLAPIGSVLGPMGLAYAVVFARSRPRETLDQRSALYGRFLIRVVLLILGVLLVLILVFRATGFRERWFQPLLACGPVAAMALLANRLDSARLKVLAGLGMTVMVLVACIVPGRIIFGEQLRREEPLMRPYAEVGRQIRAAIQNDTVVVTDSMLTGGNLRLALPLNDVLVPQLVELFNPPGRHWALVWDTRKSAEIPLNLRTWAESVRPGALEKGQPRFYTATYYHHQAKQLRIGALMLE